MARPPPPRTARTASMSPPRATSSCRSATRHCPPAPINTTPKTLPVNLPVAGTVVTNQDFGYFAPPPPPPPPPLSIDKTNNPTDIVAVPTPSRTRSWSPTTRRCRRPASTFRTPFRRASPTCPTRRKVILPGAGAAVNLRDEFNVKEAYTGDNGNQAWTRTVGRDRRQQRRQRWRCLRQRRATARPQVAARPVSRSTAKECRQCRSQRQPVHGAQPDADLQDVRQRRDQGRLDPQGPGHRRWQQLDDARHLHRQQPRQGQRLSESFPLPSGVTHRQLPDSVHPRRRRRGQEPHVRRHQHRLDRPDHRPDQERRPTSSRCQRGVHRHQRHRSVGRPMGRDRRQQRRQGRRHLRRGRQLPAGRLRLLRVSRSTAKTLRRACAATPTCRRRSIRRSDVTTSSPKTRSRTARR